MTGQLKDAVGRLREMRRLSAECDGGYPATDEGRWQSQLDHLTLAEAYLAEHPADDDEAIRPSWLVDLPCTIRATKDVVWASPWSENSLDERVRIVFTGTWVIQGEGMTVVRIPAQKTRGDVRRLCAALGVPLDECKG